MIYRLIAPEWAVKENGLKPVLEGEFTDDQIVDLNTQGYNVYHFPNSPSKYTPGISVNGTHIDQFNYVFVDFDLKQGTHKSKEAFLNAFYELKLPEPTMIIDSGHGIHIYWQISDLDVNSYLSLQRRLMRSLKTDEAVSKICQLMRVPGTINTKNPEEFLLCEKLLDTNKIYPSEELDRALPAITEEDKRYVETSLLKLNPETAEKRLLNNQIPLKFAQLLKNNKEVKKIWAEGVDDRSKADFRLAHIMYGNGFTKEEATTVLSNSAKAISRAPVHRMSYATNIVDQIFIFEDQGTKAELSRSVTDILKRSNIDLKGSPFRCHSYIDDTAHGFRLGQVIGLVAGSGVGKTAMALNMFLGFVQNNPDYHHFFVPLEQPVNEIADRWKDLCGNNTQAHDKVHVISNYEEDGTFRHLSLDDIKTYLLEFQKKHNIKVGCVVIDHIGALKKQNAKGENQDLMNICHTMKAFAIQTNCLLVMQSQAPREKAGIGDLELNKDAAYGTLFFEAYCDYVICIWQPLKRCYNDPACPTVTAFKFGKIRHKKKNLDKIQEDVRYLLYFDPITGLMSPMTQDMLKGFSFWNQQAVNKRSKDRKTDVLEYTSTLA